MTKVLSDSDSFTDPVQAIEDGDALDEAHLADLNPQQLSNRTRYLLNRQQAVSSYTLSESALATNTLFTLTDEHVAAGYTNASNAIQVPAAGRYKASLTFGDIKSSDTANPKTMTVQLLKGASTPYNLLMTRFSATAADYVSGHHELYFDIATPSSEKISVKNISGTGNIACDGTLIIERVT